VGPCPFNTWTRQLSDASACISAHRHVEKRFSRGFELFSGYTWSHSIDDGTGPAISPRAARTRPSTIFERANSVNDPAPNRWVTSAIFSSCCSEGRRMERSTRASAASRLHITDYEVGCSRPFNIITRATGPSPHPSIRVAMRVLRSLRAAHNFRHVIPRCAFGPVGFMPCNGRLEPFPSQGIPRSAWLQGNLGPRSLHGPSFFPSRERWARLAKEIPLGERLRTQLHLRRPSTC